MTYEEMNELAENLFNEGDLEGLKEMAEENGIDQEFVSMYVEGEMPQLCDPMTAAMGKIELEEKELKPKDIMVDWIDYLKSQLEMETLAIAVRNPEKRLKGMIGALLKWSFSHQQNVDKDILKAAGVNASKVTLGIPGMGTAKKIIREYYLK